MECLPEHRIQEYCEGLLSPLEHGLVRDHLLVCPKCRRMQESHQLLHKKLQDAPLLTPPDAILTQVMKRLYPEMPVWPSVLAMLAASVLFLITWVYIYFDFANNSLIKALQMTGESTSTWITQIVRLISSVFSAVYASFKAINAFLEVFLHIELGVEIVSGIVLTLSLLLFYLLFHLFSRKFSKDR